MMSLRYPASYGMLIGSSYGVLSRDVLTILYERLDEYGIEYDAKFTPFRHIVIDPHGIGAVILIGSGDNAAQLKGPTLGWVGIDEPAKIRQYIPGLPGTFWEVVSSRLRAKGGPNRLLMTGTPEGDETWPVKVFEYDIVAKPDLAAQFEVIQAGTWTNPYLPDGYMDELIAQYDARTVQEKICGIPAARIGGVAYYCFERRKHVKPVLYDSATGPVVACLDFNVEPLSGCMLQCIGGRDRIFKDFELEGRSSTFEMAKVWRKWCRENGVDPADVGVYPDPSGKAGRTSGASDHDILRQFGFTQIRAAPGNPTQVDRINAMNARLQHGMIEIDPSCKALIADLTLTRTRPGTGELDKRDKARTHMTDALANHVCYEHPIRRPMKGPGGATTIGSWVDGRFA